MSMLSAQADELRTLADKLRCVRFDGEYISNVETLYLSMGAMREAADTIESLRDRLQELQGGCGESRYSELFGTPERTVQTLIAARDVCKTTQPCYPKCPLGAAPGCPSRSGSGDYDALLEWLRGEDV